jgi:hypothetical protein
VLGNMTDNVFRLEKEVKELKRAGCRCKCQGEKGDREEDREGRRKGIREGDQKGGRGVS